MTMPFDLQQTLPALGRRRSAGAHAVRVLLLSEAATFAAAAAIHLGVLLDGYRHSEAATAETVIALVLLVGLALTWARQPWPPRVAFLAQAFAFVGVVVGLITIALGVGPQTAADVVYHVTIMVVLAAGLTACARDAATTSGAGRWARR